MPLKPDKELQINPLDHFSEQGYEVISFNYGWACYEIIEDLCYIEALHIYKEHREKGCSANLANIITKKAKKAGCKRVSTTINTCGKINVTRSMKTIISYGFQFDRAYDGYLLFTKEL